MEVEVDFFSFGGVDLFAAVFEEFVDFGVLVAGDVADLGGVPEQILIGVLGNLLADQEGVVVVGVGQVEDFDFDGDA